MGMSLRDRLQRLREMEKMVSRNRAGGAELREAGAVPSSPAVPRPRPPVISPSSGWTSVGHETLKRSVLVKEPLDLAEPFPRTLGVLAPDLAFLMDDGKGLDPGELLFFDLETTGLSRGAGTVAFLAAFGRLERGRGKKTFRLRVDQYLLLDYPGEGDFLDALIGEFKGPQGPPMMVSYNGKSFDAQILMNRCLMNGVRPPEYRHADLLHPCRRLWKRVLPSCSQGEIETSVLGLDRSGDVPGAMAPEIWFSFLKTGDFSALGGIADHNVKDISGLARIFACLADLAGSPLGARENRPYDLENLALYWRKFLRQRGEAETYRPELAMGEELLQSAAAAGHPRALYIYAQELFRRDRPEEAARCLADICGGNHPQRLKALALRKLSLDAERRLKDRPLALSLTEEALALEGVGESLRGELERRRERLGKW